MWNDSAIKATNPSWTYPILDAAGPIRLVVRSENVATTAALKTILGTFEPAFRAQIGNDNKNNWTAVDTYAAKRTIEGVLMKVKETPYSIRPLVKRMPKIHFMHFAPLPPGRVVSQ